MGLPYPRIIAHRCGGKLAAENSLAGLAAAARIGCRGVEFDTLLSADGVAVLMHDETVDRTTNGHGAVGNMTVAQLRRLDLGGEPVPLLTEALARCRDLRLWANVELKTPPGDPAALGRVAGALLREHWDGRGVISSFSLPALVAARREAPGFDYALLAEVLPADWEAQATAIGAVGVHLAAARLTAAAIREVGAAGLALACYTVNRHAEAERLLAAGVTAVFTDHPELWHSAGM